MDLPAIKMCEYDELRRDIARRGVVIPLLVDAKTLQIIDGRIRNRICEELGIREVPRILINDLSGDDLTDFRLAINLYRRHLSSAQKRELVAWHLRLHPESSDRKIAGETGVSDKTVAKVRRGAEIPHPDRRTGRDGRSHPAARATVYAMNRREVRAAQAGLAALGDDAPHRPLSQRRLRTLAGAKAREQQSVLSRQIPTEYTLVCCDFGRHEFPPGEAHLALCDPPWLGEWAPHRADYAAAVFRSLRPGGLAVCYCGHYYLPEWIKTYQDAGFAYTWMVACINGDGGGAVRDRGTIRTGWRPVLLLQRPGGKFKPPHMMIDVLRTEVRSKVYHPWEQPVSEAEAFVRALSGPGDVVVDLTVGSGTSGVACAKVGGRVFYGCDEDAYYIEVARGRIADALLEVPV